MRVGRRLEALVGGRRPPAGVQVERVGAAAVRLHRPAPVRDPPHPAVLWIHGGGYVSGMASQDDRLCRHLVQELGAVVAAVDYRRAPEHPFPAALHDCHDALVWLTTLPEVDASRIAIGGASAGGGLAASLSLLARDRGEVQPVFQLLSYPMLDDRTVLRKDIDERHFRLWNNRSNRYGWESYLGSPPGAAGVNGLAVPARHDDLQGLPPAWIGVGTVDLFYDEGVEYAQRLRAIGNACELHVVDGAFHGFDSVRPRAAITRRYRQAQAQALSKALRRR